MAQGNLQKFEFGFPVRVFFGNGLLDETGRIVSAFGPKKVLIVAGGSMERLGCVGRTRESLGGIESVLFDGIAGEPTLAVCDEAAAFARKEKDDAVIGLGGGSVLDTAKAAAMLAVNSGGAADYTEKKDFAKKGLPFIAIPSTSGSGSEVTRASVFKNPETHEKAVIRSGNSFPAAAIVDPLLTLSCPPRVTAESGMDAMTHAVEAFVSSAASPITDDFALRAVRLANASLEPAVAKGKNVRARHGMSLASLLAGMAISNAGTGACHAFAHSIGGKFDVPHGRINAIMLPHVMQLNLSARREKFSILAKALGENSAEAGIKKVRRLAKSVGIKETLKDFNITKADFSAIADGCFSGTIKRNPKMVSKRELLGVLEKAL